MATIYRLLGIFCLVVCWGFIKPSSDFLEERNTLGLSLRAQLAHQKLPNPIVQLQTPSTEFQTRILAIARSQLGIREATGKNDGAAVEAYLSYTGNKKGEPWCASFVSWIFGQAGIAHPRTAWSPSLFPKQRQTLRRLPASIFGIYYPKLQRIAHCGLVETIKGNWVHTIEGNTNVNGAREGDGVYRKVRHQRTIAVYADWLSKPQKGIVP